MGILFTTVFIKPIGNESTMNVCRKYTNTEPHCVETRIGRLQRSRSRSSSLTSSIGGASNRTAKNRKTINAFLRRMGDVVGKGASLNSQGVCYFHFRRFVIALDVPDDPSGCFRMFAMVFHIKEGDDRSTLIERAMELNYNGEETRGSCLGLHGDEINLSYSSPVDGLSRKQMIRCLEDFMQTALDVHRELEALRRSR